MEEKYISKGKWFAIFPVRLETGRWAWLRWVEREVDDRPLVYLGLMETITYREWKENLE